MDIFQILDAISTGLCLFLLGHMVLTKFLAKTFASRIKFGIVDVVITSLLVLVKSICLVLVVIKKLGTLVFLFYALRFMVIIPMLLITIWAFKLKVLVYKKELAKKQ